MLSTIYEDASAHPDLFHWFGISLQEFKAWLRALPLRVHPELVECWRRTGGGDLFESETILGPLIEDESENVLKMNEFHWSKGLPTAMLIFHIGSNVSASFANACQHNYELVVFRPGSYDIDKSFCTFNDWYQGNMRAEYASRYGLG